MARGGGVPGSHNGEIGRWGGIRGPIFPDATGRDLRSYMFCKEGFLAERPAETNDENQAINELCPPRRGPREVISHPPVISSG